MRFLALVFMLCFSNLSHATLFDRGLGLIYDSDQNITWLQDANYAQTSGYDSDGLMTFPSALAWAQNLVFGGYSDWRLPDVTPVNGINFNFSASCNGSSDYSANLNTLATELGYNYHTNLHGISYNTPNCMGSQPNWGLHSLSSTSFFTHVQNGYWVGTLVAGVSPIYFDYYYGLQSAYLNPNSLLGAWAVREGDIRVSLPVVSVPEPLIVGLFGLGLFLMVGFKRDATG